MHARTLVGPVGLAASLLSMAVPALAGVAGTGTAHVNANFISKTLTVTATFGNTPGDIPGVNLGTLAPFTATGVSLTNIDVFTGASFKVPFATANHSDSFRAVGDISCPQSGCTTLPGTFGFLGVLDTVAVSLLPPDDKVFTFDGSLDCTGNAVVGADCNGPYALNYFNRQDIAPGAEVTLTGTQSFFDPVLGRVRTFETRVTLSDVTTPGSFVVTGSSRIRGNIPAPYVTSTDDGFNAIYFDVSTTPTAISTNAEVCAVVDADLDGIVDGTTTAVSRLAGLHYVSNAFVVETIRIDGIYACVTVSSLSPFAFVATPDDSTSTTTLVAETSTTTTTPSTTTTTTQPPCATAHDCLGELKGRIECPEGLVPPLSTFIDKKVSAVGAKLALALSKPTKAKKFGRQAKALLTQIDKKAAMLAKKKKNGISADCRQSVGQALAPTLGEIASGSF